MSRVDIDMMILFHRPSGSVYFKSPLGGEILVFKCVMKNISISSTHELITIHHSSFIPRQGDEKGGR